MHWRNETKQMIFTVIIFNKTMIIPNIAPATYYTIFKNTENPRHHNHKHRQFTTWEIYVIISKNEKKIPRSRDNRCREFRDFILWHYIYFRFTQYLTQVVFSCGFAVFDHFNLTVNPLQFFLNTENPRHHYHKHRQFTTSEI